MDWRHNLLALSGLDLSAHGYRFWVRWLFDGNVPLALTLLIINSLFLIMRLFDNGGADKAKSDWNSGPSLVFQTGLLVANASAIAIDASMRGWI